MSAIRVARGYTGREKIVKFEGCYHGHADFLLAKAGSGIATLGLPECAGVPYTITADTITIPFNDLPALRQVFSSDDYEIACVIVEPVVGNMGCVLPAPGYLETLRELTTKAGAVLIFDEVMTGFRLAYGGAQERFAVTPDMTTLGKIAGGGLPLAAYGGKAAIMDCVAPVGSVYQAGTLSGNPLAVTAGLETLAILREQKETLYPKLDRAGEALAACFREAAKQAGVPLVVNQIGSMITAFFTDTPAVTDFATAKTSDTAKFGRWFHLLLESGVYWPPSQFESAFLSAAMGDEDLAQLGKTAAAALHGV
jgi:glutamate-1-semialdehyde 2,1-aminomutase